MKLLFRESINSFGLKSRFSKVFFTAEGLFKFPSVSPEKTVKLLTLSVGVFCLILAAFSAIQLSSLKTSYSIRQFTPEGHPLFVEGEKIRQTFFLEENSGYLIVLKLPSNKNETWIEPSHIHTLKNITDEIRNFEGIRNVISLSEVEGIFESEESLTIGSIFENTPAENWRGYIADQPLIQKQLITKDLKSTLIIAEPEELGPEELEVLSAQIQSRILEIHPDVQVEIGGVPALQGRFASMLLDELKIYLILCFIIFCLAFSYLIRGRSALILAFASLCMANLTALGILSYLGISFSVLLTTLPIILSIAVVSLCVHCLHLWSERLDWLKLKDEKPSLVERFRLSVSVIKELALPNFLGSLTTAIGFLSLSTSPVPIIKEYGIVVAVSVMGAWALAQILFVGFMAFTSPRLATKNPISLWAIRPLKHSRYIFVSILMVSLALGVLGTQIGFSARLFDDLPEKETTRVVTEKIDKNFGGVLGYDLILESETEGIFKSPESALKVKDLLNEIENISHVGSAFSYTDLMNDSVLGSPEKLAETFFLFSLSSANPLRTYITEDGQNLRFSLRFNDAPSDDIKQSRQKIVALAKEWFSSAKITEAGLSVRAHTVNEEVARSLIFGFVESLLCIGIFLVFVFRSLRWALVACIPNLVPPAALLGAMAYFETPIKPTIALIFSIALGLAFNNTVYLLGRLKRICRDHAPSNQQLRQALMQEGYPCLSETLLMFFGFMIFLSSTFQVNQTFGVYMLLAIFSGFIGDLFFLPALINIFPKVLASKISEESSMEASEDQFLDKSSKIKIAASLALIFTVLLSAPTAEAAVSSEVKALLEKVQKKLETKDDKAKIKMVIIEPNGQKKEREMELSTLREDRFYAKVRILSPADVKDTGFLAHVTPEDEQHWIYVPSTKKVRRVVGSNKNAGILGSELTIDDLDPNALRASNISIESKDSSKIVLSVTPEKGTSPYTRVLTAISTKQYLPLRTIYFKGKKQVKSVDFLNYKEVSKDIWRAQKIKVVNYESKRGTELILSDMKSNTGLDKNEFTQNSLKFN